MSVEHVAQAPNAASGLRRDVTVWGSYMWGYADVGADVYVALGLVIAASQGYAPLAFLLAGLVYIMIGLAYTELAATYPVAGGGQFFAMRGLGDFWGFVAGSALLLDYTIDIALFSVASAGYFNFLVELITGLNIGGARFSLGSLEVQAFWLVETLVLIGCLIWLNIRGIKESSFVNEAIGVVAIAVQMGIVFAGFILAWHPDLLVQQWVQQAPTLNQFMYGSSLAIISYVGLESISQAAQETRRPATVVPRTSISLIFTVFVFAVSFSSLGLGILPWQVFGENVGNPVAKVAEAIPFLGVIAGPLSAALGASILLISANSGVMSASRLVYSMSHFGLVSNWFDKVHPRFQTPVRTIVIFSMFGVLQTVLSFLTPSAMDTLGNLYAFGASLGYLLVFAALVRLRFTDPYSPRAYKMPINWRVNLGGKLVDVPLLGFLGMLGVGSILFTVVLTHEIGRIAGPAWVLIALMYYWFYRRRQGRPFLGSAERDWEGSQKAVLESAEEYELLEEYKAALSERDKREAVRRG
ncbi:MAG: APC family permease [Bacteroidetes bacterium]|nr:APC family permease [Bacteroidota bacterium]MCL5025707.1 APC family permease [Chloroflexota bacterium]